MKSLNKTSVILIGLFWICSSLSLSAQERPFRIGPKFGWPQLIGLNFEYVSPFVKKRLAVDLDASYIPINFWNIYYKNIALSADYYLFKEGYGLYVGLGLARTIVDYSFDVANPYGSATPTTTDYASASCDKLAFKIGGKHGKLLYFRWELGYSALLKRFLLANGSNVTIDNSTKTFINSPGTGFNANIGFGFSF